MKTKTKIDITFGSVNESKEKASEVFEKTNKVNEIDGTDTPEEVVMVTPTEDTGVKSVEEEDISDAYAEAVDRIFSEYKEFQQGFHELPKYATRQALMMLKLNSLMENYQKAITAFHEAEYVVLDIYEEGHKHLLNALSKYQEFLTEYPKALNGKGGLKAMKRIKDLGALSGKADQDMKAAFRSFEIAVQRGEA